MGERRRYRGTTNIKGEVIAVDTESVLTVLNSLPFHIATVNKQGQITRTNQAWNEFMRDNGGLPEQCGIGVNYLEKSKTDSTAYENILSVLSGSSSLENWDYSCHAPEEKRWFMATVTPLKDQELTIIGAVITHVDISARKESERWLSNLAYIDRLTGIPNRNYLMEFGERTIQQADKSGQLLGFLFLDCNNFKYINDTYGHLVGDQVLGVLAKRLKNAVKDTDVVFRFGGDEFCVIVPRISCEEKLPLMADRVLYRLCRPVQLDEVTVNVTVSGGTYARRPQTVGLLEMIAAADRAMYRAKHMDV